VPPGRIDVKLAPPGGQIAGARHTDPASGAKSVNQQIRRLARLSLRGLGSNLFVRGSSVRRLMAAEQHTALALLDERDVIGPTGTAEAVLPWRPAPTSERKMRG
jgi:hypothetical protein